jgi:flagellar biosynthesis GTPase FlhF
LSTNVGHTVLQLAEVINRKINGSDTKLNIVSDPGFEFDVKLGKIIIRNWLIKKSEIIDSIENVYGKSNKSIGAAYHALAYVEITINENKYHIAIETTIERPYTLQFYVGSNIEVFKSIIHYRYQCENFDIFLNCNIDIYDYNLFSKSQNDKNLFEIIPIVKYEPTDEERKLNEQAENNKRLKKQEESIRKYNEELEQRYKLIIKEKAEAEREKAEAEREKKEAAEAERKRKSEVQEAEEAERKKEEEDKKIANKIKNTFNIFKDKIRNTFYKNKGGKTRKSNKNRKTKKNKKRKTRRR